MASPTTPPILVLGSLNTDLVSIAPRLPAAGETLAANDFHMAAGGKGANQAAACARLSRPHSNNVRMAGAVGGDAFGPLLLRALQRSGVDVARVQALADAATGTAVIVVEASTGENRILIHAGANGRVTPALVGGEEEEVFSSPAAAAAVVLQLEIPLPTVLWALRAARLRGVMTVFNPAPAAAALPDACWRDVDCVVVNESEA
ncbi:Ribokinase-like protein, partial [Sphaerosporella brunnea]